MNFFPDSMETRPMDPEIKKQWVKALRSGEYRQGRLRLRTELHEGSVYCCLGVLCDLHHQTTGRGQWSGVIEESDLMVREYERDRNYLPRSVKGWSALPLAAVMALSGANDVGADFSAIADWIEEHL